MTRDLGSEFLQHGQALLEANKNRAAIERLSWSKSLFIRHDNENGLHHELDDPNRSFTTVIILPQWNHCKVPLFVQQNVLQYSSVRFICLFFINGQATDMKAIYGTKLIGCYSITSRISTQTRTVCAKANDLNIDYCQQHRLQNEVRGDIGVAKLYARQIFERVDLQIAYNEQLQKEIEQQLFG
ncbi:unnamed protein product [Rotaria sp. Silwood1]|nr:unnamed protein product [Rotaria sp. Silwood1]CAF1244998.1 unnamed protein product [Rotaria sp. Silwood1]